MRNIIDKLSKHAESKGYKAEYISIEGIQSFVYYDRVPDNGDVLVGITFPILTPNLTGGAVESNTLNFAIMFGRKSECDTASGIDELPIEKWNNRMYELYNIAQSFIEGFFRQCNQEYGLSTYRITPEVNRTSINIDFVVADITVTEWK